MRISKSGLDLLKDFEKCKLKAYKDEGGVWTIGWGHTGPEVVEGLIWTQQKADDTLEDEISFVADQVRHYIGTAILTQGQFDALCCFAYNVGVGALRRSTLLDKLLRGDIDGAANEFERWNMVKGKVSKGLVRRREAERDLFLS